MNARYPHTGQLFLTGDFDWTTDPVKCLLIGTTSYAYSAAHRWRADIPTAMEIAVSGTLTGRTVVSDATGAAADADDVSFGTLTGNRIDALVLFVDTGSRATSPLITFHDNGSGIPRYPSGDLIEVKWHNGADRIFRI